MRGPEANSPSIHFAARLLKTESETGLEPTASKKTPIGFHEFIE